MDFPNDEGRGVARYLDMQIAEVTKGDGPVRLEGRARPTPAVVDERGRMHMGPLGTMCDAIGGFCGGLGALPDGWVVTTNMMLRATDRPVGASIALESEVLRAGRTAVVTTVRAEDEHGFVVGGVVRSAVLVPEGGAPPVPRPAVLDLSGRAEHDTPFEVWLAGRSTGRGVEIELRDDFRNPWGIMHGGVTGALVDAAAREVAGPDGHVNDLVIHFVAPARVGPVRADVDVLGRRPDGALVRVTLHDRGADDRTVAFAVATVA